MIYRPTTEELAQIEAAVGDVEDPQLADNLRFHMLFAYGSGVISRLVPEYEKDAKGKLRKYAVNGVIHLNQIGVRRVVLWRRQFIEGWLKIRNKDGQVVPAKLNPSQRKREAEIIRQERAGVPVRQIDLKARQIGNTTHTMLVGADGFLRSPRFKGIAGSMDNDTASQALSMLELAVDELPRSTTKVWNFKFSANSNERKVLEAPMKSEFQIISAQKKQPARGYTVNFMALDELAFWEEAEKKSKSMRNALPRRPGTYGFAFSTANGAAGLFYRMFMDAWEQRTLPMSKRSTPWNANFFPWFWNPEYRWTQTLGVGQQLPPERVLEIKATLTEHEKWLLKQTYLQRWRPTDPWTTRVSIHPITGVKKVVPCREGVGWQRVDYDQLAWRRDMIRNEHSGDPLRPETWTDFQEEYPSTPEEAFIATGRMAFDAVALQEMSKLVAEPEFRGSIIDTSNPEQVEMATMTMREEGGYMTRISVDANLQNGMKKRLENALTDR